jgi:acetolactate synthase-1/2/3 large subunit
VNGAAYIADFLVQRQAAIASNRPTVLDVRVDPDIRPLATGSWDLPPLQPPTPNFGWQQD